MDQKQENLARLTQPLLDWYRANRRQLPWREKVTPYGTWVSEIMLQQTRVTAVLPYYRRFMQELPRVEDLAQVSQQRLFKLWEGLGYYSRARNLQRAAQMIVEAGAFPSSRAALEKLPGIGPYTAGAIASIAFGEAVPAVDGNVLRVAARVMGDGQDITLPATRKEYEKRIGAVMSREDPGAYNQALMELGALVCLPNGMPLCAQCPARDFCAAHLSGKELLYPLRRGKKPRQLQKKTVFVLKREGRVALRRRPEKGLLALLWEFPWAEGSLSEQEAAQVLQQWGLVPLDWEKTLSARHIFTHVEWEMTGYVLTLRGEGAADWTWADPQLYRTLAIPSAFARFDQEARESLGLPPSGVEEGEKGGEKE